MSEPLVSFIVPVYNVQEYLKECIDSVINQTFRDWELILVDDGSTDDSGKICDDYLSKDSRIKVVHKNNAGVGRARNTGISYATGDFLLFVDSDDFCDSDYLMNFVSEIQKEDDLIVQGYKRYRGYVESFISFKKSFYNSDSIVDGILKNNLLEFGAPYCKLFRRDIILKNKLVFNTNYSFGEDTYFFFSYLSHVKSMRIIDKAGYFYRIGQENSLSRKDHHFDDLLNFADASLTLIRVIDENGRLEEKYSFSFVNLCCRALINMYRLDYNKEQRWQCVKRIKDLNKKDIKLFKGFSLKKILLVLVVDWPFRLIDTLLFFYHRFSTTFNI